MDVKERLIHRDLSWLNFNERVLEEAVDSSNPLLERVRFLAIFINNLDEFFMVRIAFIKRLVDSGYNKKDDFGYYPHEVLAELKNKIDELISKYYEIYKGKTKKELEKNKIFLKKLEELDGEQQRFAKRYFDKTLFPIITPMAVDQGRPFPVRLTLHAHVAPGRNRGAAGRGPAGGDEGADGIPRAVVSERTSDVAAA